ncbi:MAG: sensor domain-containing diguanylate cyclase [Methylophilus sp.]|nr:sensor domain-containing diguanylate cyclase [Methylophilus sp.]
MEKPEIPSNEKERLSTLRSLAILDTPTEGRFDSITRIAKRVFNVPIAVISLVDENRQWFKSCIGLDVKETSRDVSFCGHAILGNETMIVSNAAQDQRFADNPLVTGFPNIQFYAGCPIKAPNGQTMGTLCIIDQKPRHFEHDDLIALKDLAMMVEREIATLELATIDELTGIPNRRYFMQLAQQSIRISLREKQPISLIFLDLNSLKKINDQYGHAEGDFALIKLAQHMENTFRDTDIVARLSGDEFVALLNNTSAKDAKLAIVRLKNNLDLYNQESHASYDITFSYGLTEMDLNKPQTLSDLLAAADALMYEHKRNHPAF